MKYVFQTDVPGYRNGQIANFDPDADQTQARLKQGFIKPYKEQKPFDPVKEKKASK